MSKVNRDNILTVKKILSDGPFSVKEVFPPALFTLLGGDDMLALIQEGNVNPEAWKSIRSHVYSLSVLNPSATSVMVALLDYVSYQDSKYEGYTEANPVYYAVKRLADFIFTSKHDPKNLTMSDNFHWLQDIANAAMAVSTAKSLILTSEDSGDNLEDSTKLWESFEAAKVRLSKTIYKKEYWHHAQLLDYWMVDLLLNKAVHTVKVYQIGNQIGGYSQLMDGSDYAFVGPMNIPFVVSKAVLDALVKEGWITENPVTGKSEVYSNLIHYHLAKKP